MCEVGFLVATVSGTGKLAGPPVERLQRRAKSAGVRPICERRVDRFAEIRLSANHPRYGLECIDRLSNGTFLNRQAGREVNRGLADTEIGRLRTPL